VVDAPGVWFHYTAELHSYEILGGTVVCGKNGKAGSHGFHHGEPIAFMARRENIEVG